MCQNAIYLRDENQFEPCFECPNCNQLFGSPVNENKYPISEPEVEEDVQSLPDYDQIESIDDLPF